MLEFLSYIIFCLFSHLGLAVLSYPMDLFHFHSLFNLNPHPNPHLTLTLTLILTLTLTCVSVLYPMQCSCRCCPIHRDSLYDLQVACVSYLLDFMPLVFLVSSRLCPCLYLCSMFMSCVVLRCIVL
jgi:hypothetical protein